MGHQHSINEASRGHSFFPVLGVSFSVWVQIKPTAITDTSQALYRYVRAE
jgi:hypothetical protein